jgi:hypothetical protein
VVHSTVQSNALPNDRWVLSVTRTPGIYTGGQTAVRLGVGPHTIPILVRAKLIKPLGNPSLNSEKLFAAITIEAITQDPAALDKIVRAIQRHWKQRNKQAKALANSGSSEPSKKHAA